MHNLLYLSSSQYSGSTLLSFLLNTHPLITTTGHMTGWHFKRASDVSCSCGARLDTCPFYKTVSEAFSEAKLPFDLQHFGTAYSFTDNERLDRYLTSDLPLVTVTGLERLRDWIVSHTPILSQKLKRIDKANEIFIRTTLTYCDARVFVDNSQDPYRLRHLQHSKLFDIANIHLVRDPRGVVLSMMKHSGWDARTAVKSWIRRQSDIIRITTEIPSTITIFYEDLCEDTNRALAKIHKFSGLDTFPLPDDFKVGEHHILGNAMRLRNGTINPDKRWIRELPDTDARLVAKLVADWKDKTEHEHASSIFERYFGSN